LESNSDPFEGKATTTRLPRRFNSFLCALYGNILQIWWIVLGQLQGAINVVSVEEGKILLFLIFLGRSDKGRGRLRLETKTDRNWLWTSFKLHKNCVFYNHYFYVKCAINHI